MSFGIVRNGEFGADGDRGHAGLETYISSLDFARR
jgi:hypothetical protein